MSLPVNVAITYLALPGMADVAREELAALIETVVAKEPACQGIQLFQGSADPHRLLLTEQWDSEEAYRGPHMQTAHLRAFRARAAAFLAGPPEITYWHTVAVAGSDSQISEFMPFLRSRDAAATIDWLVAAFGFTRHLVVPGPDGTIVHAELRFGSSVLMLGSSREDALELKTPAEAGGVTQGVCVVVADIDAHFARAKAAGATIVQEPLDTDHGSRMYIARDPDGHFWVFDSYRPAPDAAD